MKAYVRWVDHAEYLATETRRVKQTQEAIRVLRDGNGKPPFITSMHMRLGSIGLTFERMQHIIAAREAKDQDVKACLEAMAEAIVHGTTHREPPGKDNKRVHAPQIWLTHGNHQVTISPFWEQRGIPNTKTPAWVVTGYEMQAGRPEETTAADPVDIQILNAKPRGAK